MLLIKKKRVMADFTKVISESKSIYLRNFEEKIDESLIGPKRYSE